MFLRQGAIMVPIQLTSWLVLIGTLATFHVGLTVLTALTVLLVVLVNHRSRLVMRACSHDFLQSENNVSRFVADMLRGARNVKMYALETRSTEHFTQQADIIRDAGTRLGFRQIHEQIKAEGLQYIGMGVIVSAGIGLVLQDAITVGMLVAFIGSVTILMNNLTNLMNLNLIRAQAEAGLSRIDRLLQVDTTTPEPRQPRPIPDCRPVPGTPLLHCEDLCFSYDQRNPVLQHIQVTVQAGSSIALVGTSGSGKTTFAKLLQRLYDPDAGRITLAGIDLRDLPQTELRSQFGVVPQDPFLFQASLRDNIRILRSDCSEQEVHSAVERAALTELIAELPDGLDTWIGEGGSTLSGGQKQRVAIARVLLADPPLYIFDEATAALDTNSERQIQTALAAVTRERTSIIIAHRLSTIRHVDRILVFDHGRIIQDGSYDQLAKQSGRFRDLLRAHE